MSSYWDENARTLEANWRMVAGDVVSEGGTGWDWFVWVSSVVLLLCFSASVPSVAVVFDGVEDGIDETELTLSENSFK